MVEEAVAMVEEVEASVVGMVEASAVAAAISLVEAAISLVAVAISLVEAAISLVAVVILLGLLGIVLPAIASHNTKERTLRGTKIISGTTALSFLEVPLGTEIPIRMIIRTTAIMTTMTATIMMGNTHQPK
jgi:hypothetical protein